MTPGGRAARTGEAFGTVLLIDDDRARAAHFQNQLQTAGHLALLAADGAAGLRMLSAHECDLVLCEVLLPDIDGFEVCRAIKQAAATRDIPVLLVLAADDDLQRERAVEAGADDVVIEPVERGMVVALIKAQLRIFRMRRQLEDLEGLVVTLARAVEERDATSVGLAERVAHWAMQLGGAIGLPDDQLTQLYKAALLHDVGMLAVPVGVISKQGRLDPAEFSQVKRHPLVAQELLRVLPDSEQLLPAVRYHHERTDGAGYPDGLAGTAIPLFARIIAIADAFVALTSDRAYRRRRPREEMISTLRQGAGKQWDASLVETFLKVVAATDSATVRDARPAG